MHVVYEALGDILRMDFVVTFLELCLRMVSLELWLRMISLKLWLGIEGKHVTFFDLWLEMADEYEHSLSCGSDRQVLLV